MNICLKASFLLASLISFHSLISAQEAILTDVSLQWFDLNPALSGDLAENDLFSGSYSEEKIASIPSFVKLQRIEHNVSVDGYRFLTEEVTSVPEKMLSTQQIMALESDWKVETKVTDGGGISYLSTVIVPFRMRNGQIERLLSFTLETTLTKARRQLKSGNQNFADNSVLASGSWYKIAIARDGVYKIDRSFLNELGIDANSINPQQINIYGNGGELLSEDNSVERSDDLIKNAIHIQGESDGSFDNGDYILFYGKGPDSWELKYSNQLGRKRWIQTKHYYSDSAYYFLRIDDVDPLRIQTENQSSLLETHNSTVFQDFQYSENDLYNLAKSGREFYGDAFDINVNASYTFNFPNISLVPASIDFAAVSRSIGQASTYTYTAPGLTQNVNIGTTGTGATSQVGQIGVSISSFNPTSASIPIGVTFNKGNADAQGWLDYLTINATRNLLMTSNQMKFRDTLAAGVGNITRYSLGLANSINEVWDISDFLHPKKMEISNSGGVAEWKVPTDQWREFISFTNGGYLIPTAKGMVPNQNLHGLQDIDLVIITAPAHQSVAEAIGEIHAAEGLNVTITTSLEVFNEFSSGNPDVTAIRSFMKMFYDRADGDATKLPENLLLIGDGTYLNNKGYEAQTGSNMIVFESDNSLSPVNSYVSDDYFVFLSDDDISNSPAQALDCGVGRIPASSPDEAADYLGKIRAYIAENVTSDGGASCLGDQKQSSYGSWRNLISFVSDDQDGNGGPYEQVHLTTSDSLAGIISREHPEYDIAKLYMDAYKQETTPGGERYPEGEEAIRQRVENGTLLITYIGHGGERGWAHERILDIPTIQNWTNRTHLSVFLTATCELARYDDPGFNSAGEILLMNPNGGAIAMLTTTRIVFSGQNFQIDLAFFDNALEETTISNLTLGKINQLTKNNVAPGNDSKPNFSLLGDPALKMAYPKFNVYTTQINGINISAFEDTLKSLQEVEFKGYVGDNQGNTLSGFNGFIYPTVYDKKSKVFTQNNDGGVIQEYKSFNKIIYRGKASVSNGEFSFRFVVPYDINYAVDSGRVSYYSVAQNDDAHGFSQKFLIGSSQSGTVLNTVGPKLTLFMNDTTFIDGGVTNTKPLLMAKLLDENGINTVGNGIGHDISAVLDNDTQNPIILNDYYESDLNTYKSGEVRYQLNNLSNGDHVVRVKAWDVHNNSSEKTLEFTVAESATIALDHVLNYPNPFTTHTEFWFEHNQACDVLDVRIQVFTVSGKLVKTLTERVQQNGFRSEPIAWDGTDDYGDRIGKGVYVYKLEVRNATGQRAEQFERLVILK